VFRPGPLQLHRTDTHKVVDRVTLISDTLLLSDAGWSSLAARRAHNPKVTGSNPVPATSHEKVTE